MEITFRLQPGEDSMHKKRYYLYQNIQKGRTYQI